MSTHIFWLSAVRFFNFPSGCDTLIAMVRVRSAVAVLGFLALTACGSSSKTTVTCEQQFWNGSVNACLPKGWKVLSRDQLTTLGVPEETVAAFQFETPHAGQLDTVTVTKEPLSQALSTPEYSASNMLAVSTLPEYKLIDKIVVTVDGAESAIHVFSARPSPDQPVRRYYQLSATVEKTGYTFTGSFPLSVEDSEANEVLFILKNASFKEPAAAAE